jgi:hypothetical protein
MMIGVLVGPTLPVTQGHRTEESVRGFDGFGERRRDAVDPRKRALQIGGKIRRSCPGGSRIVRGIGLPSMRPADRRPQPQPLDHRSGTRRNRFSPRSNAQNHLRGITEVAEHLVWSERAPAAPAVGPERGEAFGQGAQHFEISDRLHMSIAVTAGSVSFARPPATSPES